MTEEFSRAVYIFSQCVCAQARIEGMAAENELRKELGKSQAYGEDAFEGVIEEFNLGHNSVVSCLNGYQNRESYPAK